MHFDEKILQTQKWLLKENVDGWLLYDFRRSNDLACQFLEMAPEKLLTRRYFYWIPKQGMPIKIVHGIENAVLDHLPGEKLIYRTWQEWEDSLRIALKGSRHVAMEYSPRNALPYVAKVDAGTVELVRSFHVDVVSSANLLQQFTSVWTKEKLKSHLEAAKVLCEIVEQVWSLIQHHLKEGKAISEYDVQKFMLEQFSVNHCVSQDPPICAVNANSANPHYEPTQTRSSPIRPGDLILIDLWCKKNTEGAAYADITRVAVAADKPNPEQKEVFDIVRQAQKAATALVIERFSRHEPLAGWEVDQACRDVIMKAGFGEFFIHRTGHNIDTNDHGNGAHIDNYETHDDRALIPGTCFSIEPGIYLPGKFGVRLEYDVYLHKEGKVEITGGEQDEIKCLG